MSVSHLVFLLEEPSLEATLTSLLPKLLPATLTFELHQFGGKQNMLKKLPQRLAALANYLEPTHRVIIVVDRDDDDCRKLKARLNDMSKKARLVPKAGTPTWQVAIRIAVEELEAWFFGDWQAVLKAYPRVAPNIPQKAAYRVPDAIKGGTCEALGRILSDAHSIKIPVKLAHLIARDQLGPALADVEALLNHRADLFPAGTVSDLPLGH